MYEFHFEKKSSSGHVMDHYLFENPYYRMVIRTAEWSDTENGILYPIVVKPKGKDLDVIPELTVAEPKAPVFLSMDFPPGISGDRLQALAEWLSHMEETMNSIRKKIKEVEEGKYG